MKELAILTEKRYLKPKNPNWYTNNILLEDQLVSSALENLGLSCSRVAWDSRLEVSKFNFLLFRTTWNYFDKLPLFLDFLEKNRQKTCFINPYNQIMWNLNKKYLLFFESMGINIPPTIIVKKGEAVSLSGLCHERGWDEIVIKPCVSAAAWNTHRIKIKVEKEVDTLFYNLSKTQDMIIQLFQKKILSFGEISLMMFNGVFSHAVLKKANQGDFRVQDDFGGTVSCYVPRKKEIDFANKLIDSLPFRPIYARVDIILDNENKLALSELELIEPEMWFRFNRRAPEKIALAIKSHIKS